MWNVHETSAAGLLPRRCPRTPDRIAALAGTIPKALRGCMLATAGAGALSGLLQVLPAQAVEFGEGDFQGSLDTTLSQGLTLRVEDRDSVLAGDVNGNDGNLNYDRGVVSNASKITTDLDIGTTDFGAFVRASAFIDYENQNGARERTPLSDAAKERVGRDIELLDAYVTGTFDAGESIVDARFGKHVLNWGESTFIPNGINAINHFDVSKLRLPGSELREALLPVALASVAVAPTDTLSVEGFYQIDWQETEIDPVGSYYSTTDYVGPGAANAVITIDDLDLGDMGLTSENNPFAMFGATSVAGAFSAVTGDDPEFLVVGRGADHEPGDSGQFGVALRYLAEDWNNTELGVYFMNYHSRLPLVGAHTGTAEDAGAGLLTAGQIGAAGPTAVGELVQAAVVRALTAAQCPSPTFSQECAAVASNTAAAVTPQFTAAVGGAAAAAGINEYSKSGHYFIEYPEDIQLYGVSFNTEIGATGWALQGEYSYRRDAPLQLAERVVFARALNPFTDCLRASAANPSNPAAGPTCIGANAQSGLYDADVAGYIERDVSQVQATATRVFGPTMGADGLVFLTEVALMQVHDMPEGKGVAAADLAPGEVPLESPAGGVLASGKADADATSWGYRLAARLDYNNAIGAVNLYPYTQFLHDVNGNSPAPSGPFVEGRTALTVGLRADYLSRWQADLGYTRFAGDGNELSDRDFVAASIKYSF